jgi:hypothetical protein
MALYSANQAFAFTDKKGVPRVITHGQLMSDSDPDFKGKEALFESVEVAAERPAKQASGMEDASAEPNAKRSISTVRHAKSPEPDEPGSDKPKEEKPAK